jgi:hypothetical protein
MPPPELDLIRQRYAYACGYCDVTEISAGGVLTIDHYHPLSADGDDNLDNLVYACVRCNQYKHTYWPTSEERARGFRILHPLHDIRAAHYQLDNKTGQLEPLTETGRFHIALLRLNRPQLVQHRLIEQLRKVLERKLELLEKQIHEMEETIAAQTRYISALEDRLD